jgi:hypothetical protein
LAVLGAPALLVRPPLLLPALAFAPLLPAPAVDDGSEEHPTA